jgi:polyisoprenoid-binding protein YceI
MRKKCVLSLLLLLSVVACASPGNNVDKATVGEQAKNQDLNGDRLTLQRGNISFTGYGPGKSHTGRFTNWTTTIYTENGSVEGGEATIDMTSMRTGISELTAHLRGDAFFQVDNYPTATFSTTIEGDVANGTLTMRGVTKRISFPINASTNQIRADFTVDLSEFGISHPATRDEARIQIDLRARAS